MAMRDIMQLYTMSREYFLEIGRWLYLHLNLKMLILYLSSINK